MANLVDLRAWLRDQCADFRFNIGGVFQRNSEFAWWPFEAAGPDDLEERLAEGGHLLPLPKEPAALANMMEVSIVNFLSTRAGHLPEAEVRRGSERGYPDLEISGAAFGGGFHAVDVKAARRARNGYQTQSRITLYTGNTYFRWPDLHWPGTFRPFSELRNASGRAHDLHAERDSNARVEDLEIIVQEPWRIASRERSSTTREYIGAVTGHRRAAVWRGVVCDAAAFYEYWRRFPFRVSPQVQTQLQRLLTGSAQEELAELAGRRHQLRG